MSLGFLRACAWSVLLGAFALGVCVPAFAVGEPSYVLEWGSYGSGAGQFQEIAGVAVDSHGDVYVADSRLARIQKFDGNGVYLMEWDKFGPAPDEPSEPRGLHVGVHDGEEIVLVSDTYIDGFLQSFALDGTYRRTWGAHGFGATISSADDIYAGDWDHQVRQIPRTFWPIHGEYTAHDLAADDAGHLFLTFDHGVQRYDLEGNFDRIEEALAFHRSLGVTVEKRQLVGFLPKPLD